MIVGDYAKDTGRTARRAYAAFAVFGAAYAALGAVIVPELGAAVGTIVLVSTATAFARNKWTPLRGLSEEKLVRSLRKARGVEGVVVPLRLVESQEGPCCAFDHVVHRCNPCACTRPCSSGGGRFRAEDRGSGRFLVRNEREVVLVDGHDVRFASGVIERMTSHFHRLEAGQRVRVHGDLIDASTIDEDVRALFAGVREMPRVLVPGDGASVLIEPLDR